MTLMRTLILSLIVVCIAPVSFAQDRSSEHARKTLEIYRAIIEVDTSKLKGNTPKVAQYLADELIAAGFPAEDVEVVLKPPTAALVARYRGNLSSDKSKLSHPDAKVQGTGFIRLPAHARLVVVSIAASCSTSFSTSFSCCCSESRPELLL